MVGPSLPPFTLLRATISLLASAFTFSWRMMTSVYSPLSSMSIMTGPLAPCSERRVSSAGSSVSMSSLVAAARCSYNGPCLRPLPSASGWTACACSAPTSLCECCFAAMMPIWSASFSRSLFPFLCPRSITSFSDSCEPTSSSFDSGSCVALSSFVSDAFGLHIEVVRMISLALCPSPTTPFRL